MYRCSRPCGERLTYKPLTNNAVLRKIPKENANKSNKSLRSSFEITIVRLCTGGICKESMCGGTGHSR
jgi:hypothetical protein